MRGTAHVQTVTINNLVSDKSSRATDHSEYVDNPKFEFFPYTGYTQLLTVNGNTKVPHPLPSLPFPFLPSLSRSGGASIPHRMRVRLYQRV